MDERHKQMQHHHMGVHKSSASYMIQFIVYSLILAVLLMIRFQ